MLFIFSAWLQPRRKMSWYFGDISPKYWVSEHLDTIYVREISVPRYFINLSWISPISRDLLAFYHFIFNISHNLGDQMRINAIKLLKMPQDFRRGGSNPSQKVWLATSQPLRQVCPLVYNVHQIYIKSNSSYKHNLKNLF